MAAGSAVLLKVNTGTVPAPVWTTIGGQTGVNIERGLETYDTTTKDSAGWMETEAGNRSWSCSCEGLVTYNDAGYNALVNAWRTSQKVQVHVLNGDGSKEQGMAWVTSIPQEAPDQDAVKYSVDLEGTGPLQKV